MLRGTYDLLDRIIAGDSIDEVRKQVIISTFDYVEFLDLRGLIQQKFPQQSVRKKDRSIVSQNEYLRVMNISSLIVYQFLATRDLLVISPGVEKTIQEYSDFMGSFLPLRGDTLSMSIDGSLYYFMMQNSDSILHIIRRNAIFKNIVVSLSTQNAPLEKLMLEYNKIMETKIADTSTFLFSVRDSVRKSLLRLRSELSVSINAKYGDFFVIISPYVNAIIFQRIESQPMDYNKQLMNALLEKLQSIYETNKNGVKYKLGLWTGLFLSGAAWDTSGTKYPVFSLRINDRLEYALYIGGSNEVFVYLGGFADILIKELTNNTKNQFGYCGLGVSFSSFSFATSMTIPVNATNLKLGIVVSMMYDLPIEKILK